MEIKKYKDFLDQKDKISEIIKARIELKPKVIDPCNSVYCSSCYSITNNYDTLRCKHRLCMQCRINNLSCGVCDSKENYSSLL